MWICVRIYFEKLQVSVCLHVSVSVHNVDRDRGACVTQHINTYGELHRDSCWHKRRRVPVWVSVERDARKDQGVCACVRVLIHLHTFRKMAVNFQPHEISALSLTETREDRTKRLFRHYTVGSYDNFTSHR